MKHVFSPVSWFLCHLQLLLLLLFAYLNISIPLMMANVNILIHFFYILLSSYWKKFSKQDQSLLTAIRIYSIPRCGGGGRGWGSGAEWPLLLLIIGRWRRRIHIWFRDLSQGWPYAKQAPCLLLYLSDLASCLWTDLKTFSSNQVGKRICAGSCELRSYHLEVCGKEFRFRGGREGGGAETTAEGEDTQETQGSRTDFNLRDFVSDCATFLLLG